MIFRFCRAIWFTALIRSAIWARVKPSGKMIFSVGGATIGVGFGFGLSLSRIAPAIAKPTSPTNARTAARRTSAKVRLARIRPRDGPGGRSGGGGRRRYGRVLLDHVR